MNTSNNLVNRMTMPRISEEPDVPNEDNRTSQDGRLYPAGISSQVRHYEPATSTTTVHSLESERIIQSAGVNVERPVLEAPLTTASTSIVETGNIPISTSTIPHALSHAESITKKDEKAILTHMPRGLPMESEIRPTPQGSIPVTTTSVIQPQGGVTQTQVVRETTVVTEGTGPLPGAIVVDQPGANLAEINQVESQYMRDSGMIRGTDSPSYHSRWEAQQFELSNMRHESHQAFENWEANRNKFVMDRLNITNDLVAGMDRTLEWLDVGVHKVILFFKEREAQELEYSKRIKHSLTQVGDHFENSEHPEVLSNFSRGLKENDIFHSKEKRSCEILGTFIKKDILDWILLPTEKNYKQQATALRTPITTYKKKLDHLAHKRSQAYNKYFKTYDHIQKTGKPAKSEDSIFKRQLKYSLAAREELRMLRLYDEQSLAVINEFAKLSSVRMQEVQRAYTMYLQRYKELYQNTSTPPEPILSLIETSHGPDNVPNLFTVKNLLQPLNYEFVRQTLGMPMNVTYESLSPFLVNFPDSVDPTRTSFVLREWEAVKTGGLLKKPKACSVIATTNNNLLIVEKKKEDEELGKVKEPMQLRFTRVEDVTATEDGTVLKVVERAPGTIFQHTTRTKLKFETQDEAAQFMQFINSQTSGEV